MINITNAVVEPAPYVNTIYVTPTPTVTPTASSTPTPSATPTLVGPPGAFDYGSGADGDVVINGSANLNTSTNIAGRICEDAFNDNVAIVRAASVTLANTIPAGCLNPGDEVLLISLQGGSSNFANVGNYEIFEVAAVIAKRVLFTTVKKNFYGENAGDDSNIGTASSQQRVMLQRVPNYRNLVVNGSISASNWDSDKNGVLAFKVSGTLSGSSTGIIKVGSGYQGGPRGYSPPAEDVNGWQGESYAGLGIQSAAKNEGGGGAEQASRGDGAGGGYGTYGNANNSSAGLEYGDAPLSQLFLGSGGGGSGAKYATDSHGKDGGDGGGAILILAKDILFTGTIRSNGRNGGSGTNRVTNETTDAHSGAGSGGSIFIAGDTIVLNALLATGGSTDDTSVQNKGQGAEGRIAIDLPPQFGPVLMLV